MAFLVGTRSSSSWSRPDLEMQFQTRSIVPNYFERSLPALTRCQYLLLFLLTLKQKLELKLLKAEASIFPFPVLEHEEEGFGENWWWWP